MKCYRVFFLKIYFWEVVFYFVLFFFKKFILDDILGFLEFEYFLVRCLIVNIFLVGKKKKKILKFVSIGGNY